MSESTASFPKLIRFTTKKDRGSKCLRKQSVCVSPPVPTSSSCCGNTLLIFHCYWNFLPNSGSTCTSRTAVIQDIVHHPHLSQVWLMETQGTAGTGKKTNSISQATSEWMWSCLLRDGWHIGSRSLISQKGFPAPFSAYWSCLRKTLEHSLEMVPSTATVHQWSPDAGPRPRPIPLTPLAELLQQFVLLHWVWVTNAVASNAQTSKEN